MRILCVGANHKTAPVAVRERLVFDRAAACSALQDLRDLYPEAEFIVLSTCNRAEIYVARPLHGQPREEDLRAFFGRFHDIPREEYESCLYLLADSEAVRHLFNVASGLDSMVTGEDQILAQIKDSFRLAQEQQTCRSRLMDLFQGAFSVAKEVRRETSISCGRVSVASVAAEMAHERLKDLTNCTALSVGAGKMNELMLKSLRRMGIGRIIVTNRTPQRAFDLAADCAGEVMPFDQLTQALALADVVVSSTAAAYPIITTAKVQAAMASRPYRPLMLVDIAVPRDVEVAVGDLPGVSLSNIDDIKAVVEKTVNLRDGQVEACREIIDAHVASFFHRLHVREVVPALEALYFVMRGIGDEELDRVTNKFTGQPDADREIFRRALHRTLRRILHRPIINMRSAAGTQIAREHAVMLRKLFNITADGKPGMPPGGMMDMMRNLSHTDMGAGHMRADAMPPEVQEAILAQADLAQRIQQEE